MVETDVLVAGSGPAGASAAPVPSTPGVDPLLPARPAIVHRTA